MKRPIVLLLFILLTATTASGQSEPNTTYERVLIPVVFFGGGAQIS